MKKLRKFILPLFIALVMIFTLAGSALAYDPDEVDVDIDIDAPDSGYQGDEVTVTATVTVTAVDADACFQNEEAYSQSGYEVEAPDGTTIDTGGDAIFDWGPHGADASNVYTWMITFMLSQLGDYEVDVFGLALADMFGFGWWDDVDYDEQSVTIISTLAPSYDWYNNGQFELVIQDLMSSHRGYTYSAVAGLASDVIQFGPSPMACTIRVDIPAGTLVTDANGDPVLQILIIYHDYYGIDPYLEVLRPYVVVQSEIHFSQPVVVSKVLGGGGLQEIVTFSEVAGGVVPIP